LCAGAGVCVGMSESQEPLLGQRRKGPNATVHCREKTSALIGTPAILIDNHYATTCPHWCFAFPCVQYENEEAQPDDIPWDETLAEVAMKHECKVEEFIRKCFAEGTEVLTASDEEGDPFCQLWIDFKDGNKTFKEFAFALRRVFIWFLESKECGLHLETEDSVDHDEAFLTVMMPVDANPDNVRSSKGRVGRPQSAAELHAERLDVLVPMTPEAYDKANSLARNRLLGDKDKDWCAVGADVVFYTDHRWHSGLVEASLKDGRIDVKMSDGRIKNLDIELVDKPGRTRLQMPQNSNGIHCPNYAPYSKDASDMYARMDVQLFEGFSQIQLISMVKHVVDDVFNLSWWKATKLINDFFPMHEYSDMRDVEKMLPSYIPQFLGGDGIKPIPMAGEKEVHIEAVKKYLGEECGFYYQFLVMYCQDLLRPVIYGIIVQLLIKYAEQYELFWRSIFAVLIASWASHICESMSSKQAAMTLRWGQQENSGASAVVEGFDEEADDTYGRSMYYKTWKNVFWWRTLSHTLTLVVMLYVLVSAGLINYWAWDINQNPANWRSFTQMTNIFGMTATGTEEERNIQIDDATKASGPSVCATLLTVNIKLTSAIWDSWARWLVTKENHKTTAALNDSLAVKLFIVYLFAWTYPYLYIAFIKKSVLGCTDPSNLTEVAKPGFGDCTPELNYQLIFFFTSSGLIDALLVLINWLKPMIKVRKEIKNSKGNEEYTYTEIQGKLSEPILVLDDMTELVVNFTMVVAFTYVCPRICLAAFLFNCFLSRFYMWQRLRLQRRCEPVRTQGMPIWNSLMRYSMFVACTVNAGLAAFVQRTPTQQFWTMEQNFKFFIGLEHVMFFMIAILAIACDDVPKDALRRQEYNDSVEFILLDPKREEKRHLNKGQSARVDVTELDPDVFKKKNDDGDNPEAILNK